MLDRVYAETILEVVPLTMMSIRHKMRLSAKSDMTVPQFRVLARLTLADSPLTNQELADWIGVSPPTMTRMIDSLEKRNLVERMIEPSDRRAVMLTVSFEGSILYKRIHKSVQRQLTKKVSQLTAQKKKILFNGLSVLREMFL